MRIRDLALKTCQRRWTIGRSGERGSGISVLAARHDDDDDDDDVFLVKGEFMVLKHTDFSLKKMFYVNQPVKKVMLTAYWTNKPNHYLFIATIFLWLQLIKYTSVNVNILGFLWFKREPLSWNFRNARLKIIQISLGCKDINVTSSFLRNSRNEFASEIWDLLCIVKYCPAENLKFQNVPKFE